MPDQPKKKPKIPRQDMPRQDPKVRARNFDEVALGYAEGQARLEASRCLQCKKPKCVAGCPVEVDIPAFIEQIAQRDSLGAIRSIKQTNSLPGICGRVCPQEEQCEKECVLGRKGDPVAIGRLERFAADYELAHGVDVPALPPATGKKVAVVGAGPAGLTVAGDLAKLGHQVTVFEALHKPGGVLVYGIPEFRLPKAIVEKEVAYLERLGVEIKTSFIVGKLMTVDELIESGYDAVFLGSGAGLPYFLGIPGENHNGVYSANEYLTRSNLMKAYRFPEYDTPIVRGEQVAVIGGGNVAMDGARTALRLGADHVYLVYRRSRVEMPAREEEIENALEEGIDFRLLTNPTRILGDDQGWVRAMECIEMALGEPDESGRRRPIPKTGSEFVLDVDTVVVAIGGGANPLISATTPDLATNSRGYFTVDDQTMATSKPGVYAGGDIVTGSATVISAMGAGRRAAQAIQRHLAASMPPGQEGGGG